MAISAGPVNQLAPAVDADLKGILPLPLQRLQTQGSLQFQLIGRQLRCGDHPSK